MDLIQFCLRNPVKVSVGALLLVLLGLISLKQIPLQLTPEVARPEIRIRTRWAGASAYEIEREIVQEQEDQLKGVPGVLKTTSLSRDSTAQISLEFAPDANMQEALVNVNNRLQQVKEYPADADEPVVTASTSSDRPIAYMILVAKDERIDITEYGRFAEDYVEARLQRVPGVADVEVSGGRDPELQVIVDPELLASHRLTLGDLRQALQDQNQDTSGGDVWEGKRRYVLRTRGQFTSPDQVENTVVSYFDDAPVYVRDVAVVRLGFKKLNSLSRRKGKPAISVRVVREVSANDLDVLQRVQQAVDELNAGVLKERGLELSIAHDKRRYIYSAIGLVQNNIYIGGILTALILFCFLRVWRSTAVICLSMPISIVGTFLLLHILGRTLNVISLAGMAFAVGMVVDNAVVVLENIHRKWQRGAPAFEAALQGTKEVWGAVLAATLTTLVVYIPVILIPQEAGQLFRDIAIANSCAVAISLIVSVTVIPVTTCRFLRRRHEADTANREQRFDAAGAAPASQDNGHQRASRDAQQPELFGAVRAGQRFVELVVAMNTRIQQSSFLGRVAVVVLLLGATVGLGWVMMPEIEYLPAGNRSLVMAIMMPPPGYNNDQMIEVARQCEKYLQPYWSAEAGSADEAALRGPAVSDQFFFVSSRSGQIFLGARTTDLLRGADLVPIIQKATDQVPGLQGRVAQASLFERTSTGGRVIDVEITGPDYRRLVQLGEQVKQRAEVLMPDGQAVPKTILELSSPEVHVVPRREQAAQLGLTAKELGFWIDALNDGAYVSDYWSGNDKIDLSILAGRRGTLPFDGWDERFLRHTQQLAQLPIATQSGRLVTVGSVADVVLSSGLEQISHSERQRAATIEVRPSSQMPLERAVNLIRSDIIKPMQQSGALAGGYQIRLSGTADKLYAAWDAMKWNLAFALLVTYLLMAGLFESWTYPAIIMISVPPAAVGGLFGLWLLNLVKEQHLDMLTMLGFVTLIGIVVNNAILIVHQSLTLIRRDGIDQPEAIAASIRTRVRPIFMTTTTTLFGLAPLVLLRGAGSELYRGLGSIVLGGLATSTVFTLILVPTVMSLTFDAQRRLRRGSFQTDQGLLRAEREVARAV